MELNKLHVAEFCPRVKGQCDAIRRRSFRIRCISINLSHPSGSQKNVAAGDNIVFPASSSTDNPTTWPASVTDLSGKGGFRHENVFQCLRFCAQNTQSLSCDRVSLGM